MVKIISIGALLVLGSCIHPGIRERGNGNRTSETFFVEDFSKIHIGGTYNLVLERGEENKVIIETDEDLIDYIDIEVFGKTLDISNDGYNLESREGIDITVIYTDLSNISISGACKLVHTGPFKEERLSLEMSGAGLAEIELDNREILVDLSGAGAVELSGQTGYQEIYLSGAGGYDGEDLLSSDCKIEISGLGGAEVYVENTLTASISGLGGVTYHGNPSEVQTNISGLGAVHRAK